MNSSLNNTGVNNSNSINNSSSNANGSNNIITSPGLKNSSANISRNYYSSYIPSLTPTSSSPLLSSSNINTGNIPSSSNLMSNTTPSSLPIYDNRQFPVELFKVFWSEKEEREVNI